MTATETVPDRQLRLRAAVQELFAGLFGIAPDQIEPQTTFVELGADSLLLLRAGQAVRDRFGVKVAFRRLMEDLATADDLAAHLASVLPQEQHTPAAAAHQGSRAPADASAHAVAVADARDVDTDGGSERAAVAAVPTSAMKETHAAASALARQTDGSRSAPRGDVARVVSEQLRLMSKQLEMLGAATNRATGTRPAQAVALRSEVADDRSAEPVAAPPREARAARPSEPVATPTHATPTTPAQTDATANSVDAPKRPTFVPFAPLDRSAASSLTPSQRTHLDALIARVTARTKGSKELARRFRAVLANNRASAGFRLLWKELVYPLAGHRGLGSHIWDVDGHEYIDLTMGFGALLFGHSPAFMQDALRNQVELGIQIGPESETAGAAAALVCELTGAERATFCNSGTEAVMVALRLARTVTGRSKIALFAGSYHGTFDGVLAKGARNPDGTYTVVPMAPGVPASLIQDVVVLDYESFDTLDVVKRIGPELAAVLVEPRQSRRPDLDRRDFLHRLREITTETGTALVFDEVVTGFRVHPGGVQALYGVRADITTYGKAVANGMPIGVVAGKATYLDAIDGGPWQYGDASLPEVDTTFFAGTFFRHPLVMAAVLASLRHIKASGPELQERLNSRTGAMAAELNAFFASEGLPLSISQFGSLFLLAAPPELRFMDLFYAHLLLRGVYVWERRVCYLSTAHTDEDIRRVVDAFKESALDLRSAGFLPAANAEGDTRGAARSGRVSAVIAQDHSNAAEGSKDERPRASPRASTYALTDAQRELWSIAQLGDDASVAYNLSMRLRLTGTLHAEHLIAALQTVVDRHDALRTSIDPLGATQTVAEHAGLPLERTDLSNAAGKDRALAELCDVEARRPFDLTRAPLVRAHLVTLACGSQHEGADGHDAHVLLLTAHHIVADGQSLGIVLDEVAKLYAEAVERSAKAVALRPEGTRAFGRHPQEPKAPTLQPAESAAFARNPQGSIAPTALTATLPAPTPFRAYVDELARRETSGEMAEAERFWLEHLRGPLPALELPLDRPRPPVQTYAGDRHLMSIAHADAGRVRAGAQRLGCTPFMVLLAAVNVLLHRLTDSTDVVVAVPAAGQPLVGADLVGHCVNVLPLRTHIGAASTFADVAAAVKRSLLDAYEHRAYPFSRMVKHVEGGRRDPSRPPLASVMFNLDHGSRLELPDLDVEIAPNPNRGAQFELEWNIVDDGAGLEVECFYNRDLFDASTIERWQASLRTVLLSASADPNRLIGDLDLLVDHERTCVVETWNRTAVAAPTVQCIHTIVDQHAQRSPAAIAVAFEGRQTTYGELRRRSDALARVLVSRGVRSEAVVALLADRSDLFLVAMLAILKAGAAYLPLDPRQPAARHRQVLVGSRAQWLLSSASAETIAIDAREGLDATVRPVLMSLEDSLVAEPRSDVQLPTIDEAQLAYVIYTSGSTGVPKGAMVTHAGMRNHLLAKVADLALDAHDGVAQTAMQSFDISVWQFLAPLLVGGRVHVYSDRLAHAPAALLERVDSDAVTVLELVPSQLRALLDEIEGVPAPSLQRLRWLLLTGEALAPDLCRRWLARYRAIPIVNAYGPTECSDDVTHAFVNEPPDQSAMRVPIGRPIANTRLYVLDERLRPRPVGVPGQLFVAGAGVGRGYRHDPAQTAGSFVPDPFTDEPGHRMYRTGDVARWRPDGSLEYLRRVDDQIKLRGFRIELGDIAAALRECAGVRDAAVTVRGEGDAAHLVAYVSGELVADSPAALRLHLQARLPRYMVPAHVVTMEALPLTPNGKVDVKALPAPTAPAIDARPDAVAPRTAEERALAAIWSDVLGMRNAERGMRSELSVHDNFFDLGGDSILAIQIVARARREGLVLSAVDIFEHQTLAALAATAHRIESAAPATRPDMTAPLTPIQHWFFEQRLPRASHWNMPALFEAHEPIDRDALAAALRAVVAHHDALRARFARGDAHATFVAAADASADVEWIDVSTTPAEKRHATIEARAAELQASLDIERGPLFRAAYFDAGSTAPGRLLLVAHHLAVDIVSWRVLAEDLTSAYRAVARGERPVLPQAASFAQWAQQLATLARSPEVAAESRGWLARVSGAARLPEDGPGGDNSHATVRVVSASLTREETTTLVRDVPRRHRARVSEALATALQMAFERWTGRAELVVDLEGHGREPLFDDLDVTRTVGWFTALYPVRLAAHGDASVADRIGAAKAALRGAPRGGLGYGLLRHLHGGTATDALGAAPQAQVVLNYRGETSAHADDLLFRRVAAAVGPSVHPDNPRRYLFEIDAAVTRGRLELHVAYSTARHRRDTIAALVDGIVAALREIVAACAASNEAALSPADFPRARVNGRDLQRLFGQLAGAGGRQA